MGTTAVRDGSKDGPVAVIGGKRKAGFDSDEPGSGIGFRETRRMRAIRVAQGGKLVPQLSLTVAGDLAGPLELDNVRPQESEIVGQVLREMLLSGELTNGQARAPRRPSLRIRPW